MKYNVETQFGSFECQADLFLNKNSTEVHVHRVNGLPPTLANVGGSIECFEAIVNELHKLANGDGYASSGNVEADNDTIHVGACGSI